MSNKLSEHFTQDELTFSQTAARKGIDNTPSPEILQNLKRLALELEEVRSLLGGNGIRISSGYRCNELNTQIGGSKTSAHMTGLAADFTVPAFGSVLEVAQAIAASNIQFDQLIHEYGTWVHIGLAAQGAAPRRQLLSIFKGTGYLPGIVSNP
ncbi:MAG: D-Ala-D-Ala carboxypeptidase family metallohydrolase [Bacteroidales bacterium]|nr:D-Ala-D-Ala carboxypeptidase family metallohydrolase [Bacteroidales bacterium]